MLAKLSQIFYSPGNYKNRKYLIGGNSNELWISY